jgi:hypothetical protein
MRLALGNVVDSQNKPKEDYAHGIPVPEELSWVIQFNIRDWARASAFGDPYRHGFCR